MKINVCFSSSFFFVFLVFLKLLRLIQIDMADVDRGESPSRLEVKFSAAVACWILGFGSLICWNSMLTRGDYYYHLFPITLKTIMLLMVSVNQILGKGSFFISKDVSWNHVREGSKTLNNIRMLSWDDGLSAPRSELDT
ncbi:hypothetical protein ES332_A03G250000v1 [Gossypium tomentosum]|uniref:Uncharacterized protein n=2 Tax=Gossypium tomentosum TaxID=34277 RepID=A0A5D2RAL3_GOSTO|nr:hypothetical protein ES332_A03G250000v1 [Gossypium tomentosum]